VTILTALEAGIDSEEIIFRFVIEIGCKQKSMENLFFIEKVCNQSLFLSHWQKPTKTRQ